MLNLLKIISVVCLSFIISNCSNPENPQGSTSKKEGLIESKIIVPAGDIYNDFARLGLPAFFNIGTLEQKTGTEVVINSLILGKRLDKGVKVFVKPIALFSFNQDSVEHRYLVTSYNSSENNHLGSEFNAFMSINNELQLSIENWFRAQCGFSSCNSYAWYDTNRTFINLD